jgi:hypothetical protein
MTFATKGGDAATLPDIAEVRQLAEELRAQYTSVDVPVALDGNLRRAIADDLGLTLEVRDLPPGVDACTVARGGTTPGIVLARQAVVANEAAAGHLNFSFAHELGHWYLFSALEDARFVALADGACGLGEAEAEAVEPSSAVGRSVERLCDVFAAAFLMPASVVFAFLADTAGVGEERLRRLRYEHAVEVGAGTTRASGARMKDVLRYPQTVIWPHEVAALAVACGASYTAAVIRLDELEIQPKEFTQELTATVHTVVAMFVPDDVVAETGLVLRIPMLRFPVDAGPGDPAVCPEPGGVGVVRVWPMDRCVAVEAQGARQWWTT